ncbi:hypothetical protein KII92_03140 [Leuconostoc gelidum subsp. gasicomitatum]|uniref:Uncharacterized protein n=1 Tax=Leuconostoc inhae TaxID=178001 RepID=A0ABM9V5A6_9LACO|nr:MULTISPECIES: hypothetical protein [Leuconostoc]KAA8373649.1 hypothetical protein FE412_01675 [Leuconostoc carnosum]MBZ5943949.1 hypothetical protein [Leuconostoc gasicomitatum]MBZ5973059.1 hypothetical protein [Leuconostoc gasicomitatum]CUW12482.1 hypothetical protein KSL4_0840 [Leuconostoc inhae]
MNNKAIVVHSADDKRFGTSLLNSKNWDRIIITDLEGKKVAEINGEDAYPATGYLVKMYPNLD